MAAAAPSGSKDSSNKTEKSKSIYNEGKLTKEEFSRQAVEEKREMYKETFESMRRALFVCLGNICRSPIAEAIFIDNVEKRGHGAHWEVDSAGLGGWHAGHPPDPRALATLKKHNLSYHGTARQITKSDFMVYDLIFALDRSVLERLERMMPADSECEILLLGNTDPHCEKDVHDPYMDNDISAFEDVFYHCQRCIEVYLNGLYLEIY